MDVKQELAGCIMALDGGDAGQNRQRILDLLSDYRVEQGDGLEGVDLAVQIDCYLAARKSEGFTGEPLRNCRGTLTRFNEFVHKRAAEITAVDIRAYLTYLRTARQNKESTVRFSLSTLRAFFTWLCARGVIGKNPAGRVKYIKTGNPGGKRPLTPEQMELLRTACKTSQEKALLEFIYSSGCKVAEAAQLNLEDMDFENRRALAAGSGGKRRTLYFSTRAAVALRQYLAERKGDVMELFCGWRRPYGRMAAKSIDRLFLILGRRAGISVNVNPTILRTTLAFDLLNAGMDLKVVQKIMGHANVKTTEIYAELGENNTKREYTKYLT